MNPMHQRLQNLLVISFGGVLLSSAALYNGYPLVFPDTSGYIWMAVKGWKLWARSIYYSYLIYLFHIETTLWPVIFMQALMLSHLIHLVLRATIGRVRNHLYLGIMVFITAFTSLPWVTGFIMPDVFTSVVILTMFLLGFVGDLLSRREKVYIFALSVIAISTHQSHVPLATGLTLVVFSLRSLSDRRLKSVAVSILPLASSVLLAITMTFTANIVYHGFKRASGYGQIFALASFLEEGPTYQYLQNHCPQKKFVLCHYLDELPVPAEYFLWMKESPMRKAGGPEAIADEASDIVWMSIFSHPLEHFKHSVRRTFRLLLAFQTGDGMEAFPPNQGNSGWLLPKIAKLFSMEKEALYNAKQHTSGLPFKELNHVHRPVVVIAFILSAACLVPLFRQRDWKPLWLTLMIFAGLFGNAFITATVSSVSPRYQSRVIWLLVFSAIVTTISIFEQRKKERNQGGEDKEIHYPHK